MKNEILVTAFAENASGPGWTNAPIWVIYQDQSGILRKECIQPGEQSIRMAAIYTVSAAAHSAMCAAVLSK